MLKADIAKLQEVDARSHALTPEQRRELGEKQARLAFYEAICVFARGLEEMEAGSPECMVEESGEARVRRAGGQWVGERAVRALREWQWHRSDAIGVALA